MSKEIKDQIKYILSSHRGRTKAISNSELAQEIGTHNRHIQLLIRELIAEGIPIASACDKPHEYFIIENLEEAEKYATSLKNRLIEDALRRRDFRRACILKLEKARQGVLI